MSGIFFSADRFPAALLPLINPLSLTAVHDALRAVILEGALLSARAGHIAVMMAKRVVSFSIALRIVR